MSSTWKVLFLKYIPEKSSLSNKIYFWLRFPVLFKISRAWTWQSGKWKQLQVMQSRKGKPEVPCQVHDRQFGCLLMLLCKWCQHGLLARYLRKNTSHCTSYPLMLLSGSPAAKPGWDSDSKICKTYSQKGWIAPDIWPRVHLKILIS